MRFSRFAKRIHPLTILHVSLRLFLLLLLRFVNGFLGVFTGLLNQIFSKNKTRFPRDTDLTNGTSSGSSFLLFTAWVAPGSEARWVDGVVAGIPVAIATTHLVFWLPFWPVVPRQRHVFSCFWLALTQRKVLWDPPSRTNARSQVLQQSVGKKKRGVRFGVVSRQCCTFFLPAAAVLSEQVAHMLLLLVFLSKQKKVLHFCPADVDALAKKKLLKRNNGIASGMIVHRPFCLLDKIVIRSTMRFVVVVAGSFQNPCNWTEPASIAYYSYPRLTPKLDAHYQTSHFALWAAFVTIFFLFFGYLSSSFRSRTQLLPLCNQPVRVSFFPRDLSFLLTAKNGSEVSILFLLSLIRVLRNQHTYLQHVSTTVQLCSWKNKRFCICFHGDS